MSHLIENWESWKSLYFILWVCESLSYLILPIVILLESRDCVFLENETSHKGWCEALFRLVTVYLRLIRPLKKVGVDYEALGTKTSTTYKQVQQTEQFNEKLLFKRSVRTARPIRGPMFQYWQELFISIVMSTTTINCCHDCDWKSKPSAKSNWSRIADASKTQSLSLNKAQYNDIDRSYRSLS